MLDYVSFTDEKDFLWPRETRRGFEETSSSESPLITGDKVIDLRRYRTASESRKKRRRGPDYEPTKADIMPMVHEDLSFDHDLPISMQELVDGASEVAAAQEEGIAVIAPKPVRVLFSVAILTSAVGLIGLILSPIIAVFSFLVFMATLFAISYTVFHLEGIQIMHPDLSLMGLIGSVGLLVTAVVASLGGV